MKTIIQGNFIDSELNFVIVIWIISCHCRHYEARKFIFNEGKALREVYNRLIQDYDEYSQKEFLSIPSPVIDDSTYRHNEF